MTMVFPYTSSPRPAALAAYSGIADRPRPIISVTLIGPRRSAAVDALLDTGADDTVFSDSIAVQLGIDLTRGVRGSSRGVSGSSVPVMFVTIPIRIADNNEQREWSAVVGFGAITGRYPLLGHTGFLQYFTATLHGDRRIAELTINPTYPGT